MYPQHLDNSQVKHVGIPLIPAFEAETGGPLSLKSPWFTQRVLASQGYVRRLHLKKKS